MARSTFGNIRRLPSGRYQARYQVDATGASVPAPTTFGTRLEASAWLARERVHLEAVAANSPAAVKRQRPPVLRDYVDTWLTDRRLRPSTRATYMGIARRDLAGSRIGGLRLDEITPAEVRAWHRGLDKNHPTARAHAYSLLRTVLATAVRDELIDANPCRMVGAGRAEPAKDVVVLTPEQVSRLADEMGDDYRATVWLGYAGQLRVGEVLALRRQDVDLDGGVVHVRRTASSIPGAVVVGPPKTRAGVRDVTLPASVVAMLTTRLAAVPPGRDELLWPGTAPGQPVRAQAFSDRVARAARRAEIPLGWRFHHLRHAGVSVLAELGASTPELQARVGHTTAAMVARYSHARAERDRALADRFAAMVEGGTEATRREDPR